MSRSARYAAVAILIAVSSNLSSQSDAPFAPFEQWKSAILAGDAATLKSLYSADPPAQIRVKSVMHDADADTSFWLGLKPRSMKVEIVRNVSRPDRVGIIFRADVALPNGQTVTVTDDQVWQKQGDQWRLRAAERTDDPALKHPADMKKDIYPADADAHAEIREAEQKCTKEHKRLLLVFGANWCFDCHVLDLAFQRPDLAPVLTANYEVVHVDIGPDGHKNADLVQQFEIPLNKGVPSMAVADSDGKLVVSLKNGEVEDARQLTPEALLDFLNKWKPQAR